MFRLKHFANIKLIPPVNPETVALILQAQTQIIPLGLLLLNSGSSADTG